MELVSQNHRKLINNYLLFIIPSWHKAIGAPLGRYINQNVVRIHSDPVIFLSTKEVAIESQNGTAYYMFGLGYYYLNFELADGKYITDNRPLTGLILTDFVYDKLAMSSPIALADDPDVAVCEHVIKVPVDLSNKSEQKLTFIHGMLTRYVFTQYKEPILELMDRVFNPTSFRMENWGHLFLSTLWDHYNQILVSDKMNAGAIGKYLNPTAGISAVAPGADNLMAQNFSSANLLDINKSIHTLKNVLMGVKYDTIDLYTLLDYLAMTLRTEAILPPAPVESPPVSSSRKRALLISAANRMNCVAEWHAEFQDTPAEGSASAAPTMITEGSTSTEPDFKALVHQFHKKMDTASDIDPSQATIVKVEAAGRENFQLRKMQRMATDKKSLPEPPQGNVEEVFLYLKSVIEENFDIPSVGKAFELARESLRKISLQSKYIRSMSHWATQFLLKQAGISLSPKEKEVVMHDVEEWIAELEEEKRREREWIEKERQEKIRLEREQLEKERQERDRLARQENERLEREREHKQRMERERIARLEQERLDKERSEKERIAREKEEQIRLEKQKLAEERENLKRLIKERKQKEKEEKARQKELKRIEKEKQKVEKLRQKEEKRLNKLPGK